ncbi:MAG: pyroglutamyl-peptidase I [Candidatus Njordarchaeia archaeon]
MIVITGFEPFGKYKINPAWELASRIDGLQIQKHQIRAIKMPVSFKKIIKMVPEIILKYKPTIFLGLGLAAGRIGLTIERVAINIMDSREPDNDGYQPIDEAIISDAPAAYFSNMPIKKIIKKLRLEGIPIAVSNSAGTHACNTLMFVALHTIKKKGIDAYAGFIHLPLLPEQDIKAKTPTMSLDIMIKGIKQALDVAIKDRL